TNTWQIVVDLLLRSDQEQIVELELPSFDLRKHRCERFIHRSQSAVVDLVGLYPLHEHAVVGEAAADSLVVLPRKQARDARAIGVRWLRHDEIVGLTAREKLLARVADGHSYARIVEGSVVHRGRNFGHVQDRGFEL